MAEETLYLGKFTEEEWKAPVFLGGPTREQVEEWKAAYGAIYMLPFEDATYIVRGLMRPEYRSIQMKEVKLNEEAKEVETQQSGMKSLSERLTSKFDNEEEVAAICTLYPAEANSEEYFAQTKAGVAGTIADVVYDKSCFRYVMPPVPL